MPVTLLAVFPRSERLPIAVHEVPVALSDAAFPKLVFVALAASAPVNPMPALTLLINESFAMPAPPAMMTAPVVEDVDAVVLGTLNAP